MTIVIVTVSMRRIRNPLGSWEKFSILEFLAGFMVNSHAKTIDLCINNTTSIRLDKALTQTIPEEFGLSRSRVQDLIVSGAVKGFDGKLLNDPSLKVHNGLKVNILIPTPEKTDLLPENIKLDIVYEDADLLVVNKPAGMVVHPAPGAQNGTLVNALLFHCGNSLSGIGGKKRPGIVHRIDKDTSGLLAAAKTDLAHLGLARQFSKHSVERKYHAFIYGSPTKMVRIPKQLPGAVFESDGRICISGRIARNKFNRKKMAVYNDFGRYAVTRARITKKFGMKDSPFASLVECELETGRTHQIRVHLNHIGHSIIGDQKYNTSNRSYSIAFNDISKKISNFKRQALHATTLGFYHPKTKEWLSFVSGMPPDMENLHSVLSDFNEKF